MSVEKNGTGQEFLDTSKNAISGGIRGGAKAAKAAKNIKSGIGAARAGKGIIASIKAAMGPFGPAILLGVAIIFVLIMCVAGIGLIATTSNSTFQIEPSQDPLTEEQLLVSKEGLDNSVEAERQGLDAIAVALGGQQNAAYEEVEEICKKNGITDKAGIEATMQYLTTSGFIAYGSQVLNFAEQNTGMYTEDELNAAIILSAYSISMDDLWEKTSTGDVNSEVSLTNIDTSTKEGKAKYIYIKLRQKGFSHNGACAVLGNIECESNFNVGAHNPSGYFGLIQWGGGRAVKMKKYVSSRSKDKTWKDLEYQTQYIYAEMSKSYSKVLSACKSSKSVDDITTTVRKGYEGTSSAATARIANAKKWSKLFKNLNIDDYKTTGVKGVMEWAHNIAKNDNYGYKAAAGCYTCKTIRTKTYCCASFVASAYYHGAGLNQFKNVSTCSGIAKICRKSSDWKDMGKISADKLKVGDILWSQNHVVLYNGTNGSGQHLIIGAHNAGLKKADQISIKRLAGYTPAYTKVYRYTGKSNAVGTVSASSGSLGHAKVNKPAGSKLTNKETIDNTVAWAIAIADNDDFHYGKNKWAHKYGCYFCGTQGAKIKAGASKAEASKTWCCNPFVVAAYVHGGGVASKCGKGGLSIGLANDGHKNMERHGFKRVSKPSSISGLKKGDVLQTPTHCMLYAGNGMIVDAAHHDNGVRNKYWKESINYHKLSQKKWKRTSKVYRYTKTGKMTSAKNWPEGAISSGESVKTYSKYHKIKSLTESDLTKYVTIENNNQVPQSMAYLGGKNFVVATSNTPQGDTVQYLKKYVNCKKTKEKKVSIGHANGLCYNPNTKKLYSVKGNSKISQVFNDNLSSAGKTTFPVGLSGVAYDRITGYYYASSGSKISVVTNKFAKKSTFNKMGQWKWSQDIGGYNGFIYSAVCINKESGKNRINIYTSDGSYCGSYEINKKNWEIEDCEVADDGSLYILINVMGSGTDYIFKTKTSLALAGADISDAMGEDAGIQNPGEGYPEDNWRNDLQAKLDAYINGNTDHKPLYKITVEIDDKTGKPKKETGVIDTNLDATEKIEEEKKQNLNGIYGTNDTTELAQGASSWLEEQKKAEDNNRKQNQEKLEGSNKDNDANLKETEYLNVTMETDTDMFISFAFDCFGLTLNQIQQLYGKSAARTTKDARQIALDKAKNTIALMHGVNEFTDDNLIENPIYDVADMNFRIGGKIGLYNIETYTSCGCNKCKEHRKKLFGKTSLKSGVKRVAGSTVAISEDTIVDKVPDGAIIYNAKFGVLVVTEHLTRQDSPTIAIYTGKSCSSKETKEFEKAVKQIKKNGYGGKARNFYSTEGIRIDSAYSMSYLCVGSVSGSARAIMQEALKMKTYGVGHGYCLRWVRKCYQAATGINKGGYATASNERDAIAAKPGGRYINKPPVGAAVYADKNYDRKQPAGHVGIYVEVGGKGYVISRERTVTKRTWESWLGYYGYGGYSFRGIK